MRNIGSEIKKMYGSNKIFIITDTNVEFLYGKLIEDSFKRENIIVKKIKINPGEKANLLKRHRRFVQKF